jgi:hypothetical protein
MIFEYEGNVPDLLSVQKSTGNNNTYKVVIETLNEKLIFNTLVETVAFIYPKSTLSVKYLTKLIRNAIRNNTKINNYKIYKLE